MTLSFITKFMHTRSFGVAVAVCAFIAAASYFFCGLSEPLTGERGLALASANGWITIPFLDFMAGIAGCAVPVVAMYFLNKIYNVLRSITSLYIALYSLMMLASPDLLTQFYTGTLLAATVPLCILFLFSCYREPESSKHIFIIFLLLSFFAATQYCFLFYLIVFIVGLGQMRIFNARALLAAAFGIITPWWIMLGFGIISLQEIKMPTFVSIFAVFDDEEAAILLLTIGITIFAMFACYVLNFFKAIAYNAKARAFNGTFTVLALVTIVAMCIDYPNIIAYIPLLNFSATMEITHYFSTHRSDKSFAVIFVILAVYASIFACQTII
ncbi:MAG: hypothetical protein J1F05_03450 [Muribaculaceae bacterium]|nr:hypothetical protein [Muribaculaceae bacterium]